MRPAVMQEYEAALERGDVRVGPFVRLELTPAQLASVAACVAATAKRLLDGAAREPDPIRRGILGSCIEEMVGVMRALQR